MENQEADLSSVRLVYTSGAIAHEDLLIKLEKMFEKAKVLNVYGLTECGRVSAQRVNVSKIKYESVGKPIKGIEVMIKNKEGSICNVREIGLVYIKSSNMMIGYFNDDILTNSKVSNGILNTGDLGYIDEDGELFIVGRADDMVIVSSHNVDPNYVEKIINLVEGVEKCIVFGVIDEYIGSKLICLFEKKRGYKIFKGDILDFCTKKLATYECPKEVYEVKQIPLTVGGKLSRVVAREYYLEHIASEKNKLLKAGGC